MHGRGGKDMYIDIPLGTAVYKLTTLERPKGRNEEGLKEEFERQMRSHLGKQYDAIKESEAALEDSEETNSEVKKELLFDSSFSKHRDVFCVAHGGRGGQGNRDWYEQTKRRNLKYWGSNRDRRLQASYYKVVSAFCDNVLARRESQCGRRGRGSVPSYSNAAIGRDRPCGISERWQIHTAEQIDEVGSEDRSLPIYDIAPSRGLCSLLGWFFALCCRYSRHHIRCAREPWSGIVISAPHSAHESAGVCHRCLQHRISSKCGLQGNPEGAAALR